MYLGIVLIGIYIIFNILLNILHSSVVGAAHGLILLPVLLSIIGPPSKSKNFYNINSEN
jgi:hypothetical protein